MHLNTEQALTVLRGAMSALSDLTTPRATNGLSADASGGGPSLASPEVLTSRTDGKAEKEMNKNPLTPGDLGEAAARDRVAKPSPSPIDHNLHGTDPERVRREIAKAIVRDAEELGA